MKKISVVIPVYYNAETLELLYEKLLQTCGHSDYKFEYVFVDDGSGDNSYEILLNLAEKNNDVKVIKLSRNFGSHSAIRAGINCCTGNCAVMIGADLQEDPGLIIEMIKKWEEEFRIVLATRSERKESKSKVVFANLYYWLVRKLAFPNMPIGGFDCFLIDRKVINVIKNAKEVHAPITGQILWSGFKIGKVEYIKEERQAGTSRWTLAKKIKLVIDSILGYSYLPLRFMSIAGIITAFLGMGYAFLIILLRIFAGMPVKGWSSMIVIMLFFSGIQLLSLGIIGEYLWRCVDQARQRPDFIIEDTTNFE